MSERDTEQEHDLPDALTAIGADLLLPGAGHLTRPLLKALRQEWGRNLSKSLDTAQRISGHSREDLAEIITDSPQHLTLLTRLLYLAGMTGHDEVLALLGAAFGDAVREPSKINEAEVLLEALRPLTPDHLASLRWLPADRAIALEVDAQDVVAYSDPPLPMRQPVHQTLTCLNQMTPGGLAEYVSLFGVLGLRRTALGNKVIELADELAEFTADDSP